MKNFENGKRRSTSVGLQAVPSASRDLPSKSKQPRANSAVPSVKQQTRVKVDKSFNISGGISSNFCNEGINYKSKNTEVNHYYYQNGTPKPTYLEEISSLIGISTLAK